MIGGITTLRLGDIEASIDALREEFSPYLHDAFTLLPEEIRSNAPSILDIGCGAGVPTVELARIGGGTVIALDIDPHALSRLLQRIHARSIASRVLPVCGPIHHLPFLGARFDIVWSEGAVYPIGFPAALQEWKRLLQPHGCMVLHDACGAIENKRAAVKEAGYRLIGSFFIAPAVWRKLYFQPLEEHIRAWIDAGDVAPAARRRIEDERREIARVREDPARTCSVYFILQRV